MKIDCFKAVLAVSLVFSFASLSNASGFDILIDKLMDQKVLVPADSQVLKVEIEEETRKELAKGKISTLPQWIQDVSLKGDLRLRHQADWDSSKPYSRIRERIRLRVGLESRVKDNIKAAFGFATGSEKLDSASVTGKTASGGSIIDTEPTSTNHTLSNGFGKAMLMVDFAYLECYPLEWLTITGGKMMGSSVLWNTTDLLWDGDINPDGLSIAVSKGICKGLGFSLNGSWLIINESNSAENDPDAYIIQPVISWSPLENAKIKFGAAYQVFSVNGKLLGLYGTPAFDYACINPSLEIGLKNFVGEYSLKIFGDTVQNQDASISTDKSGSSYGVQFGHDKVSSFGQWQVKALSRRLEQNAWISKLGDSDAYGGAVNSSGFEAIITIGITKSTSLGIDYYQMDKINGATPTTPKQLVQFDIIQKF